MTHAEGKPHQDRGRRQAEERGLRRSQPCLHLDLGLLASEAVKKYISVVSAAPSSKANTLHLLTSVVFGVLTFSKAGEGGRRWIVDGIRRPASSDLVLFTAT